jgi:hypothetical protein
MVTLMNSEQGIVQYLRQIQKMLSGKQAEFYQWVLDNGKYFKGTERDRKKEDELIVKRRVSHKIKQCFYNSQILLLEDDDLQYYEGWYVPENLFPIEHGFVVHKGKVIDVTANSRKDVIEYFGVPIPKKFVMKSILKKGRVESLLVQYWDSLQKKDVK